MIPVLADAPLRFVAAVHAHAAPHADPVSPWLDWNLRPEVLIPLFALGALYVTGWRRLWRRSQPGHRPVGPWHLAAYIAGLVVIALALVSPIDTLSGLSFAMHMVQHELLMMVAAPLLVLAAPLPVVMWGLPRRPRRTIGRQLAPGGRLRAVLRVAFSPWLAGLAMFAAILWMWHAPALYDLALQNDLVHDIEHVSFFLAAVLFWWHATAAAPRLHGPARYGARIALVLAAFAQNEILAVSIALAKEPLYEYYQTVERLGGMSVMDDQNLGGAIMWIPGGMMFGIAAIVLIGRMAAQSEREADRAAVALSSGTVETTA